MIESEVVGLVFQMLVFLLAVASSLLAGFLLDLLLNFFLLFGEVLEIEEERHGRQLAAGSGSISISDLVVVNQRHPFGDIFEGIIRNTILGIGDSVQYIFHLIIEL
jgi:hypothetical protein